MPVDIQSEGRSSVAKIGLYSLYIVADHQGIDSETVTQIVETDIFNARSVTDSFKMLHNRSSDQMFTQRICENIVIGILPTLSVGMLISELFFFFILTVCE